MSTHEVRGSAASLPFFFLQGCCDLCIWLVSWQSTSIAQSTGVCALVKGQRHVQPLHVHCAGCQPSQACPDARHAAERVRTRCASAWPLSSHSCRPCRAISMRRWLCMPLHVTMAGQLPVLFFVPPPCRWCGVLVRSGTLCLRGCIKSKHPAGEAITRTWHVFSYSAKARCVEPCMGQRASGALCRSLT
jgi:hypothetical protein